MKKIKLILWVLLFLFVAAFSASVYIENRELIPVKYLHLEGEIKIFWLLIVPFIIGLLMGALLMSFSVLKQKRRFSIEHKKLSKVEKEVENLRALPLKDEV